MALLGTKRTGHTAVIPTSGYTEKAYTLTVRYTGTKNVDEARKLFEDDLLNRHISAGDCEFIVADLTD